VPGLDELWGRRAFTCPFCDGHEFAGRDIGILGASARTAHLISMLAAIVGKITVFPVEEQPSGEDRAALEGLGVRIHPEPARAVSVEGEGVRVTAGDEQVDAAGLFVAAG